LAFKAYDVDGSGGIDRTELGNLMRTSFRVAGVTMSDEQISKMAEECFIVADLDGNGSLDLDEFKHAFLQQKVALQAFWTSDVSISTSADQAEGAAPVPAPVALRNSIVARMHAHVFDARKSTIIIEGEPGLGKSRLLSTVVCTAPCEIYCAAANPYESKTPFSVWRELVHQVLDSEVIKNPQAFVTALANAPTTSTPLPIGGQARSVLQANERRALRQAVVATRLAQLPGGGGAAALTLAPTLNDVLLLDFPRTNESALLSESESAECAETLLIALLQVCSAAVAPMVCVIDDAIHMDAASWALTESVAQNS
jgi:hypothetical protein